MKLKGLLLSSCDGSFVFRVYDNEVDEGFTDYDIIHDDLSIEIDDDSAVIRVANDGSSYIDYCDGVLGRTSEKK